MSAALVSQTNKKYILFEDKDKIVIGRQEGDADYLIISPIISRKHAVVEKTPHGWGIRDLASANGVYVNGVRLAGKTQHILQPADLVEFGKDVKTGQPAEHRFVFRTKVRVEKKARAQEEDATADPSEPKPKLVRMRDIMNQPTAILQREIFDLEGRNIEQLEKQQQEREELELEFQAKLEEERLEKQAQMQQTEKDRKELESAYQAKLEEEQLAKQAQMEQTEIDRKELESAYQVKLEEERLAKQAQMEQIEKDRKELESAYQVKLEEERLAKQAQMEQTEKDRKELESAYQARSLEVDTLSCLLDAKEEQQVNLQKEIEEEKLRNSAMTDEMKSMAQILSDRDNQQARLHEELVKVKEAVDEEKKKAKTEILSDMENVLEEELICSICAELLIEATSLGCSHSFCKYCIGKWMKKKKECPNCRRAITSHVQSLVLDNYIEKVVKVISPELQETRKKAIEERKAEEAAEVAAEAQAAVVDGPTVPGLANLIDYLQRNPDQIRDGQTYIIADNAQNRGNTVVFHNQRHQQHQQSHHQQQIQRQQQQRIERQQQTTELQRQQAERQRQLQQAQRQNQQQQQQAQRQRQQAERQRQQAQRQRQQAERQRQNAERQRQQALAAQGHGAAAGDVIDLTNVGMAQTTNTHANNRHRNKRGHRR